MLADSLRLRYLCLALMTATLTAQGKPARDERRQSLPHIVFFLIDDFGWADASWHREHGYREVQTPNMQALLDEGIELDRNYVYKFCSPTRSAVQSGRNPIHVNAQNVHMDSFDPQNPFTGVSGIPANMTGFAQRLAEAGYKHRVFSGKADFGMALQKQTPKGRGYTDSLFYFSHANDYWSLGQGMCGSKTSPIWMRDLFGTNPGGEEGPQYNLLNNPSCWIINETVPEKPSPVFPKNMEGCVYGEDLFTDFTVKHIMSHNVDDGPMLAFHAAHSIHTPMQVVPDAYDRFDFIDWHYRRAYHAMVWNVDRAVGRIVESLRSKHMYENTLIILSSDNGGPIYYQGISGGNNFPLRGGKAGNWEGGIRVNGFVSGGFVPRRMRGRKVQGLVTGWDWYATLVHGVAGLDPTDKEAAVAGLPPIDSVDQWPYLSGATQIPPRTEIPFGTSADPSDMWSMHSNNIAVHAIIQQDPKGSGRLWKLVVGDEPQSVWTGPKYPNATTWLQAGSETVFGSCGFELGCLFDLTSDPTEHVNLAQAHPDVAQRLRQSMVRYNASVWAPKRPSASELACKVALSKYRDPRFPFGWWGPFADVHLDSTIVV